MTNHSTKSILAGACALAAATMVSGCQTAQLAKYNNPADVCVAYRQPLIETEQDLNKPIAAGIVSGALIGGLIGGLATGKAGGAVAGALVGAAAGGAAGYYQGKAQQAKNQAELLAAINDDAQADATRFGGLGRSVKALQNCRRQQIGVYVAQVKRKQLTPAQALSERAKLQTSIREDGDLINQVLGSVDKRVETYVDSSDKALQNASASTVKKRRTRKPTGETRVEQAARSLKNNATAGQSELFESLERATI